jgi:hypothetical protein
MDTRNDTARKVLMKSDATILSPAAFLLAPVRFFRLSLAFSCQELFYPD